ncbi:MAG: P1 family peptidase [Acidobacteria bacterium]|nr:P1 family peptidase [Acidobacteriota bacterium]
MATTPRVLAVTIGSAAVAALGALMAQDADRVLAKGLTSVPGIKVGHHTLTERPTGCTVVLTEAGATASTDVRGPAPGTIQTDLLEPGTLVEQVHAIVLSGGSAFGLDTASGVRRFLEERGIGFPTSVAKVPIVPGAIIFDLPVIGKPQIRPGADCGYRAAQAATSGPVQEGSVGAGTGATVGKITGYDRAMKGGIGTVALRTQDGTIVAALVVVNAVGSIVDPRDGRVVAGTRTPDGKGLADPRDLTRQATPFKANPLENTTLGVVATDAALSKAQARLMAQSAHDGIARAIYPAHTMGDGDTIFALATAARSGEVNLNALNAIIALAAEATAQAIVRAVRAATGVPGYPAVRDLEGRGAEQQRLPRPASQPRSGV